MARCTPRHIIYGPLGDRYDSKVCASPHSVLVSPGLPFVVATEVGVLRLRRDRRKLRRSVVAIDGNLAVNVVDVEVHVQYLNAMQADTEVVIWNCNLIRVLFT